MVNINEMKLNNDVFYPQTHKKAVIGLENLDFGEIVDKPVFVDTNYQKITGSWTDVDGLKTTFTNDSEGLLVVSGWFCVSILTGEPTITFSSYIEQTGNHTIKSREARNRPYITSGVSVVYIPFYNVFPVKKGGALNTFNIEIILEGSGTAEIRRKDLTLSFIPQNFSVINLGKHNKV